MAPPTAAGAIGTPGGIPLQDGYQTLVHIAGDPDIGFWEKSSKPPGYDGGDAVDTTTMRNATYNTKAPRALADMTDMTFVAAYDPLVYTDALAILNVPTTVTLFFPDGSTLAFYGYIRSAEPSDHVEGTQPEMTVTITPTNWDPGANVEAGPVVENAPGT